MVQDYAINDHRILERPQKTGSFIKKAIKTGKILLKLVNIIRRDHQIYYYTSDSHVYPKWESNFSNLLMLIKSLRQSPHISNQYQRYDDNR